MFSGSCLLSLVCLVFCFHRYDSNQPAGGQRTIAADPGGIGAEREDRGSTPPPDGARSGQGSPPAPLLFFTNHIASGWINSRWMRMLGSNFKCMQWTVRYFYILRI